MAEQNKLLKIEECYTWLQYLLHSKYKQHLFLWVIRHLEEPGLLCFVYILHLHLFQIGHSVIPCIVCYMELLTMLSKTYIISTFLSESEQLFLPKVRKANRQDWYICLQIFQYISSLKLYRIRTHIWTLKSNIALDKE